MGICLGHQCIAQFFNAKIVKSSNPTHGKVFEINVDKSSKLFSNLPQEFKVTRYHSLEVSSKSITKDIPLKITAKTSNNVIMAIEHKNLPIYGVQFHPEAILTEDGIEIFRNFLKYY